ncbi:hypothetical protein ACWGOK_42475 [Streptomyces eurythermus]
MTRHNVEISVEGSRGQVLIDGHDIARCVTNLTFTAGIGQDVPTLTLDLNLIDVTRLGSPETEVLLGQGAEEALVRLGWTPPQADQP